MTDTTTRFDIPAEIREILATTIATNILDAANVYALAMTHGDNWLALVDELCEIAHANRSTDPEAHAKIVRAAEKHWQAVPMKELLAPR